MTWEKLLVARIIVNEKPVILCLQDTTALDFNGQESEDLGRLSYDAQRGMYLHPTRCITPDRIPLGISEVRVKFKFTLTPFILGHTEEIPQQEIYLICFEDEDSVSAQCREYYSRLPN